MDRQSGIRVYEFRQRELHRARECRGRAAHTHVGRGHAGDLRRALGRVVNGIVEAIECALDPGSQRRCFAGADAVRGRFDPRAIVPEIGQVSTRLPSERTNISGEADTRNSPSPRFISAP
jgi:hypothetical protein